MKKYLPKIIVTILIASGIYLFLYQGEFQKFPVFPKALDSYLGFLAGMGIVSFLFGAIGKWLNKKISWNASFGKRYFSGLALYQFTFLAVSFIFLALYVWIAYKKLELRTFFTGHTDLVYKFVLVSTLLVIFYTLVDLAMFAYYQYAYAQINKIKFDREILSHKYNALKKQLSPHFLFNSLNTASSLLYRDAVMAELFVRKLAHSYQKILQATTNNLVTLGQELEIIEAFKYLMEIRYEKALKIDINLSDNHTDILIPPLSLQLLVENAIKHNVISVDKPLYVEVYCDDNEYVTVVNNRNPKSFYIRSEKGLIENPENKSTGIGLKNIKARYAFFTEKPVKIEKKDYFQVKLPIIEPNRKLQQD